MTKARRSTKNLIQVPPEKKEAQWLIEWASSQPLIKDVIIHIANEGKRSWCEGKYLKSIGLRKGVSDFFIPIPRYPYHGLWIELKKTKNAKVSKEQQEWLDNMKLLGYAGFVAYGWVHAVSLITLYLAG